jgi:hypothetical protein
MPAVSVRRDALRADRRREQLAGNQETSDPVEPTIRPYDYDRAVGDFFGEGCPNDHDNPPSTDAVERAPACTECDDEPGLFPYGPWLIGRSCLAKFFGPLESWP